MNAAADLEYGAATDIEDALFEGHVSCALCGKRTALVPCKEHQPAAWATNSGS